jgi:hypothetical protein
MAQFLVIDDMAWDKIPAKKAIFGAQKEFTLTDRYRHKKRLTWGKPTILLCNPDNAPNILLAELDWYQSNVTTIYLTNKLF